MNHLSVPPPSLEDQDPLSKHTISFLRERLGRNVSIPEMEQAIGFELKSFLYQDEQSAVQFNLHDDPFFAEPVYAKMKESLETFFYCLSFHLSSLAGMHASQSPHLLQSQISHMRNVFATMLIPVLLTGSADELQPTLSECENQISVECIENLKYLLLQQGAAMRALRNISGCVANGLSFAHILFRNTDEFNSLAIYPPERLVRLFANHGVCFAEVAEYMRAGNQNGVRGASGLEPSGSVKELGICLWVRKNRAIILLNEYDECLLELESMACKPNNSDHWHGIEIRDDDCTKSQRHGDMIQLTQINHLHRPAKLSQLWVQATHTTHTTQTPPVGLLSTRVFWVLRYLIEHGIMLASTAKCEILIASATRWRLSVKMGLLDQSHQSQDGTGTESVVRPVQSADHTEHADGGGEHTEHADGGGETGTESAVRPTRPMGTTALTRIPTMLPRPQSQPVQPSVSNCTIPISLERDHSILEHIRFLLFEIQRTSCVGPIEALNGVVVLESKFVAERILLYSGHLKAGSMTAALQWVGVVASKLSKFTTVTIDLYKRGHAWLHGPCTRPSGSCLVIHKASVAMAINEISAVLCKMQCTHGFADDWFPSKSAKCRSKKARFDRKCGDACASEFSMLLETEREEGEESYSDSLSRFSTAIL